ncbi:glycosyltransferase involved in cell wall biosynthesis [Blastococcus xanthinilyticus]|uniref:Glycosyltransferase involved in cell wall biosynthesis n=2 Tax=Blastococcus xanthinilyticus TaxID=1564164 RepID=A0A5S5CUC2_9ACTN|nr:glycosyltransferase involved in cell wall biosynthesis [Blastococcus xanthinilyticus]
MDDTSRTHLTPLRQPLRSPATPGTPRVSVVVPTYNEAKNLPHVFGLLPEGLHEVIVVDGRSVDGTVEVARQLRPDVRVVLQNRRGKGNAMACGFAAVTGDVVVMLDADGSADPREISRFVSALVAGADYAKGSRFVPGGGSDDITRTRAWGNRWLNRSANLLFGTRYTDLCYGYNAFWVHCLPALELTTGGESSDVKLWGDGFEIETIINTRVAKAGFRIAEVPSFEYNRIFGTSNLNTWRDGFRVLRALVIERVNRVGTAGRIVFSGNTVSEVALPAPRPALEDVGTVGPVPSLSVTDVQTA